MYSPINIRPNVLLILALCSLSYDRSTGCSKASFLYRMRSGDFSFNYTWFHDNKTKECMRRYVNLLHRWRRKPPKCFGHQLWTSSGRCYSKDVFVNCSWLATRWQQYSTHLHTISTQNDTKQIIHRTTQKVWKNMGRAPSLCVYVLQITSKPMKT